MFKFLPFQRLRPLNRLLILLRRRGVVIGLALVAYVFVVFILPDLIFTRQHVLYREDINSVFNQRMQRYINAQILASCPLIKRDLILIDERLTNEGSNFFYRTTFNYKNQKKDPGQVELVELSSGHIELKLIRCPGQKDNLVVAAQHQDVISSESIASSEGAIPVPVPSENAALVKAQEQIKQQLKHPDASNPSGQNATLPAN